MPFLVDGRLAGPPAPNYLSAGGDRYRGNTSECRGPERLGECILKPVPSDSNAAFIGECKRAWKARFEQKRATLEARRRSIITAARACATHLKHERGAVEVVLFGSVARDGPFHETSDMDIAVSGVSESDYFKIMRELHEIARRVTGEHVDIDLVSMESAPDRLKAAIATWGIKL